jgi:hypothetical protein
VETQLQYACFINKLFRKLNLLNHICGVHMDFICINLYVIYVGNTEIILATHPAVIS